MSSVCKMVYEQGTRDVDKIRFFETINFFIVSVIFPYNSIETFHLIIIVNPSKIITYQAHHIVLLKMFFSCVMWTHDDCFLIFFCKSIYVYFFVIISCFLQIIRWFFIYIQMLFDCVWTWVILFSSFSQERHIICAMLTEPLTVTSLEF